MRDDQPILVQVPRFARTMKRLSIALGVVWVLEVVLANTARFATRGDVLGLVAQLTLVPSRVFQNYELWRLVTHPWLHDPASILAVLGSVLALWWFGSPLERAWGPRRVIALLVAGSLAGALLVLAASLVSLEIMFGHTLGMAGASYALVVAWGILHADEPLSFFGLFAMKGRHFTWAMVGLAVVGLVARRTGADVASLGGVLAGYAVCRYFRRGGPTVRRSEGSGRLRVVKGGGADKRWLN